MDAGEIKAAISHFLDLVVNGRGDEQLNLQNLELSLDMLAWMQHLTEPEKVQPGAEPPGQEYQAMRVLVSQQFPSLGPYRAPDTGDELGPGGELPAQDALNDLATIATALFDAAWRFQNTSEADAIRAFSDEYKKHWRPRLRNLQWYIENNRSSVHTSED